VWGYKKKRRGRKNRSFALCFKKGGGSMEGLGQETLGHHALGMSSPDPQAASRSETSRTSASAL
jgi:hypothetical protein